MISLVCDVVSRIWGWKQYTWWRHQMEIFSALLAICAGNSPVPGEFPAQRPVTRSFDVFFDLRLNKRLCKQSWGWWFETPSRPFWRHRIMDNPSKIHESCRNSLVRTFSLITNYSEILHREQHGPCWLCHWDITGKGITFARRVCSCPIESNFARPVVVECLGRRKKKSKIFFFIS